MAVGVVTWSKTSASNDVADTAINFAEGQAPSSLNDSCRAVMSSVAKWRDDIAGTVLVTGGSGTVYTLTTNQVFAANNNGNTIQFTPGSTNTGAVTLAVDGLSAVPLRFLTGVDLPSGVLISGSLYQATIRAGEWLLHSSPLAQPFLIPIGGIIDYTGSTAPNTNFVIPAGQAINRTTYASYFAIVSTTYGTGDGSTTFNVPDLTGRVVAMKESAATRLTSTYFAGDSTALGSVGGGESKTLLTANLPAYTPIGTISNAITVAFNAANVSSASGGGNSITTGAFSSTGALNLNAASIGGGSTFTGSAQGGVSTPFRTVQPTIILNKILRVL